MYIRPAPRQSEKEQRSLNTSSVRQHGCAGMIIFHQFVERSQCMFVLMSCVASVFVMVPCEVYDRAYVAFDSTHTCAHCLLLLLCRISISSAFLGADVETCIGDPCHSLDPCAVFAVANLTATVVLIKAYTHPRVLISTPTGHRVSPDLVHLACTGRASLQDGCCASDTHSLI